MPLFFYLRLYSTGVHDTSLWHVRDEIKHGLNKYELSTEKNNAAGFSNFYRHLAIYLFFEIDHWNVVPPPRSGMFAERTYVRVDRSVRRWKLHAKIIISSLLCPLRNKCILEIRSDPTRLQWKRRIVLFRTGLYL